MFTYNFLGRTGRFILTHNGTAVLQKDDDIKIMPIEAPGPTYNGFKVQDERGFTYYFQSAEYIPTGIPRKHSRGFVVPFSHRVGKGYWVNFEYAGASKPQPGQLHDFDSHGCVGVMSSPTFTTMSYQDALVLSKVSFENGVVEFGRDSLREDYIGQRIIGMKVTSETSAKVLKEYVFNYDYYTAGSKRMMLKKRSGSFRFLEGSPVHV